jgi:hypothetical protein
MASSSRASPALARIAEISAVSDSFGASCDFIPAGISQHRQNRNRLIILNRLMRFSKCKIKIMNFS